MAATRKLMQLSKDSSTALGFLQPSFGNSYFYSQIGGHLETDATPKLACAFRVLSLYSNTIGVVLQAPRGYAPFNMYWCPVWTEIQ